MLNVGVVLSDLSHTQLLFHITNEAGKLLTEHRSLPLLFVGAYDRGRTISAMIPHMSICEMWSFEGNLISTDLYTTEMMLGCTSTANRIFYVWDLEWLRIPLPAFESIVSIYRNPELTLVARSKYHADIIKNFSGRTPDYVIEDFSLSKMVELGILQ